MSAQEDVSPDAVRLRVFARSWSVPAATLTPAERDVAAQAVAGATTADIARARGTKASTVARQLLSIYDKLGVGSRVELVRAFLAD